MTHKTTDIYLTTALLIKGAEFKDIEVDDGLRRQAIFVLDVANIDVEAFTALYKSKRLQVDAFTFVDTFKSLKNKMYDRLNTH